ncbi:MAG: hypothetical protein LBC85_10025 [Fibromonadaceae bacterium]|jgi:hypothetical protein|nr:hypothetical protein [Fibromonadaceae bacterium]
MREDLKNFISRVDAAVQLCKKVLECGERIKELSPLEIGMEAYAEKLTNFTEDRGRATRAAIKELGFINGCFNELENSSSTSVAEKAFLGEKIRIVQDMSPMFAKQNAIIRRIIETHLSSLRKESAEFHHNVGVIRSYLKTPDKRTFYG